MIAVQLFLVPLCSINPSGVFFCVELRIKTSKEEIGVKIIGNQENHHCTLQGTNISPTWGTFESMIFLFLTCIQGSDSVRPRPFPSSVDQLYRGPGETKMPPKRDMLASHLVRCECLISMRCVLNRNYINHYWYKCRELLWVFFATLDRKNTTE